MNPTASMLFSPFKPSPLVSDPYEKKRGQEAEGPSRTHMPKKKIILLLHKRFT
jgi:hypothetical protein